MKPYYHYSKEEFLEKSKIKLSVEKNDEEIFKLLANECVSVIQRNNEKKEATVIICPVGPVGHYKYLVQHINERQISLKQTWFINMDEYLTEDDKWVEEDDALSFRGFMKANFYDLIDADLVMPESQRIFPDPENVSAIPELIARLGKVDLSVGGIGINGHVAFNEPNESLSNEEFLELQTRVVTISPETRTANSIGALQGAMEEMPKRAVTIGIKEIKSAEKIILGCFRNWHKGVVRRTACGEPTSAFPVTLLQDHPDFTLYMSDYVAEMDE